MKVHLYVNWKVRMMTQIWTYSQHSKSGRRLNTCRWFLTLLRFRQRPGRGHSKCIQRWDSTKPTQANLQIESGQPLFLPLFKGGETEAVHFQLEAVTLRVYKLSIESGQPWNIHSAFQTDQNRQIRRWRNRGSYFKHCKTPWTLRICCAI